MEMDYSQAQQTRASLDWLYGIQFSEQYLAPLVSTQPFIINYTKEYFPTTLDSTTLNTPTNKVNKTHKNQEDMMSSPHQNKI